MKDTRKNANNPIKNIPRSKLNGFTGCYKCHTYSTPDYWAKMKAVSTRWTLYIVFPISILFTIASIISIIRHFSIPSIFSILASIGLLFWSYILGKRIYNFERIEQPYYICDKCDRIWRSDESKVLFAKIKP